MKVKSILDYQRSQPDYLNSRSFACQWAGWHNLNQDMLKNVEREKMLVEGYVEQADKSWTKP